MAIVDLFVVGCVVLGALSAAVVAFHPNILYAAIALVFSLLSVAGLYGSLGADFLAAVQLMVYVGGIIVVILFAIMMSEHIYRGRFLEGFRRFIVPFIVSVVVLFGLVRLVHKANWPKTVEIVNVPSTGLIGQALVGPYALVFQYVVIVLLSGLIGAVVIARPHYTDANGDEA